MTIDRASRVAFYGQWVAAILIPLGYVIGRVWIGAGAGWFVVLGVVLGPIMAILLVIPPVLTVVDRATRAARATPSAYTRSTFLLWILGLVMIITKSDQADGPQEDSALSAWTGLPIPATDVMNVIVTVGFWVTWIVLLVLAIRALVQSRTRR